MKKKRPLKIAYLDCFSGISGDMCLGALVDAGAPLKEIEKRLAKLPVKGYSLASRKVSRCGLPATKVDVMLTVKGRKEGARKWEDIARIIETSALPESIKRDGEKIFRTLFRAEARVHGLPLNKIHLHELGAVDCLVDIFGTLIGLNLLGIDAVYSSSLNLGSGTVKTEHGILPVPAPAAAELLKGLPVYSSGIPLELTTPTGAAIVKTLAMGFGNIPHFVIETAGTGAGSRDLPEQPNVLRILIGEALKGSLPEAVTVIETNIDDMSPQVFEYLAERLFREGALDVFLTPITMKKMRPAVKLSVVCDHEKKDRMIDLILTETTSIGVRYYETSRVTMQRQVKEVKTKHGIIRIKISGFGDSPARFTPEYDDCRRAAEKTGIPLLEIMKEAEAAAKKSL
ncbi:MAG: nickel pincer cofactor biosynthesis protein LarC [Nitrospirae bacterium]|nr:nickel pincer cofactor biosynthesis protein LarC [Nitrospirota bacterium]